jgi:flagellar biogenesis protein FliO
MNYLSSFALTHPLENKEGDAPLCAPVLHSSSGDANLLSSGVTVYSRRHSGRPPRAANSSCLSPLYYGLTRLSILVLFFFASSLHAEETSGKVFYPAPPPAVVATPASANPVATSFFYLIFLGGMGYVAYLLWKRKIVPQKSSKAKSSALDITTTRPLGNRQFLVVVNYKDKELLLGVGPGFITRLDDSSDKSLDGAKLSQEAK